jgi:thiosulfate dehydrogenase
MKFLIGLLVGLLILPVCTYLYFRLGMAPVAAADPLMPFEGWAARAALHSRIDREMARTEAIPVDKDNLVAGARIYKENCSFCHGFRGQEQTAAGKGMFPKPPHLFRGKGVTDDPAGETYWKTANGIRLSGMPAYQRSLSEQQMWQVSLLLAHADKLPPEAESIVEGK